MIPRAAEIFDSLETGKRRFLGTLETLSPEQRCFRAQPQDWSVLQVGHHVVLAEQRTADAARRHRGMRSGRRSLRFRLGNALLWLVLKTGLRVKNPVPEAAPDPDVSLAELQEAWEKARSDLRALLEKLRQEDLGDAAYRHPIGGPFDVEEALEFLVAHLNHHERQLARIQRSPSFPDHP